MTTLTINFTTRETYLTWRVLWRAEYATISQTIRELKNKLKEASRINATPGVYWRIYSDLAIARKEAKSLLTLREQSKLEAGIQYQTQQEALCHA